MPSDIHLVGNIIGIVAALILFGLSVVEIERRWRKGEL